MKKITEIYKEYNIMPILAMHQMRTASVAMQICDLLDETFNKEEIIKACLLHDMGNIIKFKLDQFPKENEPEGIEYWQKVKYEYIVKYGNDEHKASLEIARELNASDYIFSLIASVDANAVETVALEDDLGKKICFYADNRVTPYAVTSIQERNLEAKERYKNHPHSFSEEERLFFMENLFLIEKQIFSKIKIKPEDINNDSISFYLKKIQDFSI